MGIAYKYTVDSVDFAAKCMVVRYEATGHETMLVSMRLPNVGEELEAVVKEHSPVLMWEWRAANVYLPEVGTSNTVEESNEAQPDDETPQQSDVPVSDV